jgi:uncharacterized protein with von Willebrand factor type A (vWA) domain
MTFHATSDSSLEKAVSSLANEVNRRTAEKKQEESEITRLKGVIKELEEDRRRLAEELEREKLATKVIERLGSLPPVSSGRTPRPRKSGYEQLDDGLPEKIILD